MAPTLSKDPLACQLTPIFFDSAAAISRSCSAFCLASSSVYSVCEVMSGTEAGAEDTEVRDSGLLGSGASGESLEGGGGE